MVTVYVHITIIIMHVRSYVVMHVRSYVVMYIHTYIDSYIHESSCLGLYLCIMFENSPIILEFVKSICIKYHLLNNT